tara:strand:- start:254 stop:370 length:117 start_codon:yes stop_codon:yes gene_type:complete
VGEILHLENSEDLVIRNLKENLKELVIKENLKELVVRK